MFRLGGVSVEAGGFFFELLYPVVEKGVGDFLFVSFDEIAIVDDELVEMVPIGYSRRQFIFLSDLTLPI